MIDFHGKTVLVLAPHPDDEIFGCGGFLHRLKDASARVFVLYMTNGTTRHFADYGSSTAAQRSQEIENVSKFMRFDGYDVAFEGDTYHLQLDQVAQKDLVHAIERGCNLSIESLKPDVVLMPLPSDYNQDHRATYQAAMTALRPASPTYRHPVQLALCYELPYQQWNIDEMTTTPEFLVTLDESELNVKLEALALYHSQLKSPDSPLSIHGVKTLALFRGLQCGQYAAEAFKIQRLVV